MNTSIAMNFIRKRLTTPPLPDPPLTDTDIENITKAVYYAYIGDKVSMNLYLTPRYMKIALGNTPIMLDIRAQAQEKINLMAKARLESMSKVAEEILKKL
jgi:hypothetical protein